MNLVEGIFTCLTVKRRAEAIVRKKPLRKSNVFNILGNLHALTWHALALIPYPTPQNWGRTLIKFLLRIVV